MLKVFRKMQPSRKERACKRALKKLRLNQGRWRVADNMEEFCTQSQNQEQNANKGIILSKHTQNLVNNAKERINNVLVIGGPGSGKSWHVVLPNLLQMNGSYIVLDHSGDFLVSTKDLFLKSGYRVMLLDFWNGPEYRREDSYIGKGTEECNYNPFQYLRSDADVDAMIDCMMLNTQKYARTECITGNLDCTMLEKNLLKAFIFYILDHAPEEKKNPATLMAMLLCGRTQNRQALEAYERNITQFRQENSKNRCALAYAPLLKIPMDVRLQVIKLVSYRIGMFSQTYLSAIMCPGNTDLECFVEQNTILYILIPSMGSGLEWYVGTFFVQLTDALRKRAASCISEHLDRQFNIILDNTPDTIIIPNFHETLQVWSDIGISSMLCIRSLDWPQKVYADRWRSIIHIFDALIYLGTSDLELLPPDVRQYFLTETQSRTNNEQDWFTGRAIVSGRTFNSEFINVLHYVSSWPDQCLVAIKGQKLILDKRYHTQDHPNWQYLHPKQ